MEESFANAAEILRESSALLITAGAGMGVDSGLPDFRGNEGFWNAYPPYRNLGRSFVEMANPEGFRTDPSFAWGFYGHRLELYRETVPHDGFGILRRWADAKKKGAFVMTSNVDGHFQRAGFPEDSIYEVHGSIHHLQCTEPCRGSGIWSADELRVEADKKTMRAVSELPRCQDCGAVARPNILMFGDWSYLGDRNDEQRCRLDEWLAERESERIAIVELGAGTAVPTVRLFSENVGRNVSSARLIRINVREPEVPRSTDRGIAVGALEALTRIDEILRG